MIVVAIIGVLASIAIPGYRSFSCRTKRTEAKINLKALQATVLSFVKENEEKSFVVTVECNGTKDDGGLGDPIGFRPKGKSLYRYTYWGFPADGTGQAYGATAEGCGPMAGDLWSFAEDEGIVDQAPDICSGN